MEHLRKSAANGMKILTVLIIAWIIEIFFFAWCLFGSEVKLTWQYPPHNANIVFQIFDSTNCSRADSIAGGQTNKNAGEVLSVSNFQFLATTATNFWIDQGSSNQKFYAVRAYDTVSKTNSAWATHK